ncbi:SIS domain-containing protein [Clostridium psychrophilum]|uniref:SIS domain-containing protein n=1 Tax=Clostridium psychrophilum TaxID=132926 RepID=UPI001C0E2F7F|nr:SIS domain-containing protein [Clostridium psychrophilum]MBU3183156.1 SIS domain-containing protein [Clostridium psychrophilum]
MKKSIMWHYINEETTLLKNILLREDIQKIIDNIEQEVETIYFVSHGSSNNAAIAVSDFLSRYANVRVYCYTPANFLYNCTTISYEERSKTLLIAISQTGTSRGTIEAVKKAKYLGFSVLGITAIKDSPLDKLSDIQLPLNCGVENSNAKTKGYSCTLMILMLLSIAIGLKKGCMDKQQSNKIFDELKNCVDELADITKTIIKWCETTKFGENIKNGFVIGCGMNYGTALEGQLKLMETMCIPTMFNDIEEFSHGMHRAINKNSTVILLNSEHICKELTEKTFEYLKNKTDKVIMINASEDKIDNPMVITIKNHPLTQSVLGITTIIQILSTFIPELNECDPNLDSNNDYTDYMKTRIQ